MPIDYRIKNLAYTLDPQAWESYSGTEKSHKQYMEGRRSRSLELAAKTLGRLEAEEETVWEPPTQQLPAQITDAIGRVIRAHFCTTKGDSRAYVELDNAEKNLIRLLTELQEHK